MPRPKPQKRQQVVAPGRALYRRPYRFDRARSLCELHGWPRSEVGDGGGLVGRYTAAVNRPVGRLDASELHMLFTQHCDPHYLVPVALDLMRADVGAQRELLRCVIRLPAVFWRERPALAAETVALVEGKFADEDDDLGREVAGFVAHHRTR